MQKDKSYHESAIVYNDELADFAEELSKRVEHEEPKRWCMAVSKQHRFHAKRHRAALANLKKRGKGNSKNVVKDELPDAPEVHEAEPTLEDEQRAFAETFEKEQEVVHRDAGSGQFVTEEYAEENPETTVAETVPIVKKILHTHGPNLPCGPGCPAYNEDGDAA